MTPPYPTQIPPRWGFLAHHRPTAGYLRIVINFHSTGLTYLLLELFMNCVQSILDGDAFEIPRSNFESQREMQVNLLDGRVCEKLLQSFLVLQGCRGSVELPIRRFSYGSVMLKVTDSTRCGLEDGRYQLIFCVSFAICNSFPSFSSPVVNLLSK